MIQWNFKLLKQLKCQSKAKLLWGDTPLTVPLNESLAFLTLIKIHFDLFLSNCRVRPQPAAAPLANLLPVLDHLTEPLDC